MKKNCLYTVTPWNTNIFSCGGNKHAFGDFLKKDSDSYMGNWLGADKMSEGSGAMVGALGTAVGTLGSKLIGGGYDAYGVGNGITSVGNTIGSAVSQVNPLVGGIISAGSGIIGGTVNRLWGMKTDEEALKKANSDITAMKSFTSNANTFDNVVGPAAVSNVGQVYKGGVFKKGSARRKNVALQNDLSNAVQFAYNSVDNNINNIQSDQYNSLLSNYAAFGGPIGLAPMTGALGIMQADKYINAINNRTSAIAKNNTSPSFSPLGNAFAEGGGIHIKPSHKGLFTEKANRAGMGVQAYASRVLANKEDYPSSTVRQANFARNAKGWKHDAGGSLEGAFLDEFGKDPLGAVMRYNQGLEAMAAQREAEREAAAQQAAYDDLQKRVLAAETQNQGLQSMLDSQGLTIKALMDNQLAFGDSWRSRMPEGTLSDLVPNDNAIMARMRKSLQDRGVTNRVTQDAVIANMMVESGGNPNAKNANSSARGLMQWTKPRHPKAWDWDSQADHIVNTLESGFENQEALKRFKDATDSAEAARIFRQYWERPEKHTYNWTDKWIDKMYGEKKALGGILNSKNLFALGGPDDDVLGWNPVDTRSDTTRQGYHEGNMSYGANYQGPLGTAKLVLDTYAKDHNPNLITGVAPTPYLKGKPNMAYAESYMKKHGLKSFSAANGKRYVKTPDGKVKSLESLAREEEARVSQGAVEELRKQGEEARVAGIDINTPYEAAPLWDPAVNLKATRGSINKGKSGKVSNRNAQTANDLYAFGGELGTNGTDFTNGLLEINTGSSHEENPHEGVQLGFDEQGIPNLVEEGETVYNDYVFSKRLNVPAFMRKQLGLGGSMKDEITFAAASKKIAEAAKERPNNPMDQEYMDDALGKLAQVQEAERMRMQAERQNDEMEMMNALPIEGLMQGSMGLQAAYGGQLGNLYADGGDQSQSIIRRVFGDSVVGDGLQWVGDLVSGKLVGDQIESAMGKLAEMSEPQLEKFFSTGIGQRVAQYIIDNEESETAESEAPQEYIDENGKRVVNRTIEAGNGFTKHMARGMKSAAKPISRAVYASARRALQQSKTVARGQMRPKGATKTPTPAQRTPAPQPTTVSKAYQQTAARSGTANPWNVSTKTPSNSGVVASKAEPAPWGGLTEGSQTINIGELSAASNAQRAAQASRNAWTAGILGTAGLGAIGAGIALSNNGTDATSASQSGTTWGTSESGLHTRTRDGRTAYRGKDGKYYYSEQQALKTFGNTPPPAATPATTTPAAGINDPYTNWLIGQLPSGNATPKSPATPRRINGTASPANAAPSNGNNPATEAPLTIPTLPGYENWTPYQEEALNSVTPSIEEIREEASKVGVSPEGYDRVRRANEKVEPLPTWMRYAPVFGAGIMTLTDALGLTNKPDYTYANKIEAAANRLGYAPNIKYTPIGDYMRYTPLDRLFYANQLQANARATDRALANTSGGNRGVAQAAMLANGYNTNNNLGNLYRQAEEYNLAQREKVADFNRRTNMFNSQMGLEADMANARYRQQAANYQLQGLAQAAAMRDAIDNRVGAARSANITNLLNNLGNVGRENFAMNQINYDRTRPYKGRLNGTSYYYNGSAFGGEIERNKKNKKQGRRSK